MTRPAVLGLDIGGSKTHGVRVERGQVTAEGRVGSANVASVGMAEAGRQLDLLLREVGRAGVAAVCAGAAGADTEQGRRRLAGLLAERLPDARLAVVHDTRIILAAAGLDEGAVVICGTGSVAWGVRRDGAEARAGGWGYLLGDEGSGYGLARAAVRRALNAADRGRAPSPLTARLLADCDLARPDQLLDHFYTRPERRYWADRAGVVFELAGQGDRDSQRLVDSAAAALTRLAATVTTRLALPGPVVLAGGLLVQQPLLQAALRPRLADVGLADVRVLDRDPAHGAVRLATALLGSG